MNLSVLRAQIQEIPAELKPNNVNCPDGFNCVVVTVMLVVIKEYNR